MIIPGLDKRLGGTTTLSIGFFDQLRLLADVTLVTTYLDSEWDYIDDRFKKDENVHLFKSGSSKLKFSFEQYRYIADTIKGYDLVHVHGLWHLAAFPVARIAMKNGVKYIISPHGMLEPDALNRSKVKKKLIWAMGFGNVFKKATAIHCTAQNEIPNSLKFSHQANIIYVPNGVAIPHESYQKKESQLMFIGRLHPKKGIDRLIKAFKIVGDPSLSLIIAGTGSKAYEDKLQGLIEELSLGKQITMIGFVEGEKKQKLISESQFVCVPSFSEGMPLVSLETMASGTPLLITKASNVPEVTNYNCGIELEDNNPESIAEGIKKMREADLPQMSINCIELIKAKFLWEKVAGDLYKAYEKVFSDGKSR